MEKRIKVKDMEPVIKQVFIYDYDYKRSYEIFIIVDRIVKIAIITPDRDRVFTMDVLDPKDVEKFARELLKAIEEFRRKVGE